MNICYATCNSLPDLRPHKTGLREEGGSERLVCKVHMWYIQIEEKISKVWTELESLFSITTAIKVGDKSVSPLHLRGGVRLLIRLIYLFLSKNHYFRFSLCYFTWLKSEYLTIRLRLLCACRLLSHLAGSPPPPAARDLQIRPQEWQKGFFLEILSYLVNFQALWN